MCKFVKCVETHAKHRYSVPGFTYEDWLDVPYWVCAYANRQHAGVLRRVRPVPSAAVVHRCVHLRTQICIRVSVCVCKYLDIQIYRHVDM